jgi:hypothetical protein
MTVLGYIFGNYFLSGWQFFVPYLAIYLGGWALSIPVETLRVIFVALHVAHALGFVVCLIWQRRALSFGSAFFWSVLFAALYIPGAFLEYPSDPWDHLRRINAWNLASTVGEHAIPTKFAYFWMWTFAPDFPMERMRPILDLFSAFLQFLVLYQLSRFSKQLGFDDKWAKLQAVAFLLLFGTSIFSIRYYAISSTPLALIVYLRFLALWWKRPNSLPIAIGESILLIAMMGLNHGQFLIFVVIFAVGRGLVLLFEQRIWKRIPYGGYLVLALFIASFAWGALLLKHLAPETSHLALGELAPGGWFRIWRNYSRYRETYGVYGLIGLLGAFLFFREQRKLSFFFLFPTFLLIYPPSVFLIMRTFHFDVPYRVLFAAPLSIAFVATVKWLIEQKFISRKMTAQSSFLATALCVVLFSYPKSYPWRGKLFFQFHPSVPDRSLTQLDSLNQWWRRRAEAGTTCHYHTDALTEYYLAATNGWERTTDRLNPSHAAAKIDSEIHYFWFLKNSLMPIDGYCGFLIPDLKLVPAISRDRIGPTSHHWPANRADHHWIADQMMEKIAGPLRSPLWKLYAGNLQNLFIRNLNSPQRGVWAFSIEWRETLIPPYYILLEPMSPPPKESRDNIKLAHNFGNGGFP